MKIRILVLFLLLMLSVIAAGCHTAVPEVDPDDPDSDAFWLKKDPVFKPSDIARTEPGGDVEALYRDIRTGKPDTVLLSCGEQALALAVNADGEKQIVTYLVRGDDWIPVFDGGAPIVPGIGGISTWEKAEIGGNAAVVLKGSSRTTPFTLTCTAMENENLIRFELAIRLREDYRLRKADIGLTMRGKAEVTYAQAPVGIYGNMWGYDSVGIGMPSAYLWDKGREAVIFMDYGAMSWMRSGIYRVPENGYVTAAVRGSDTVFGLCCGTNDRGKLINGGTVPSGETMQVTFYLYEGLSAKRSGLDCLTKKALVMAPVHPTEAAFLPGIREKYRDTVALSWEAFADGTVGSLFEESVLNTVVMNMNDPILTSDKRSSLHYVSYDRQSSNPPEADRRTHQDFSCNYNWLAPLAAYNRIKGDGRVADMVSSKMDSMQFYYDPEANLYRWGLRYRNQVDNVNNHLTSVEMPWQNLFFHQESYRSSLMVEDRDYSPAALSNLLSALSGLDGLVKNSGYVLSQWVDPYQKVSTTQRDVPALEIVYEPWQIGTYADVLLKAYDVTGDAAYAEEAKNAVAKVAEEVSYSVSNAIYTKTYRESAEFPITELFGSANGANACYRLFEMTGEEKWLRYSENFFAMLIQMTTWYEDDFDAASQTMTNVGLFEPTAAGAHACPWETIEALLPLTHILDATGEYAFNDLILAIFNCQRISAFHFYPVTWASCFADRQAYGMDNFRFVPIETPYNNWHGGNGDYPAMYMASMSFWNYLLYEAYAETDDSRVMTLFTDVQGESYEAAARGVSRSFIVYNPTGEMVTVSFRQKELPDGTYELTLDGGEPRRYTAAELTAGIPVTVPPLGHCRIMVETTDTGRRVEVRQDTLTRYRLAAAYNAVTEAIQRVARENFALLYPEATESELDALANYVLTYMTYEDAMAHAADCRTVTELKIAFSERHIVVGRLKKQYDGRTELHLPEVYAGLIEKIDGAYALFREGRYREAYLLCEAVLSETGER